MIISADQTNRHFVSLGAIVSIISLVTSPVTQQAIQYPTRPANVSQQASVRTATNFAVGDLAWPNGIWALKDAVVAGFGPTDAAAAAVQPLAPSCPSGECTFPRISTLGVCAAVADVSDRISVTELPASDPAAWTVPTRPQQQQQQQLNSTFARNVTLAPWCYALTPAPGLVATCWAPSNATLAFPDLLPVKIMSMPLIYTLPGQAANGSSAPEFRAVEFFWHACVKTYDIAVRNGTQDPRLVATSRAVDAAASRGYNSMDCGGGDCAHVDWEFSGGPVRPLVLRSSPAGGEPASAGEAAVAFGTDYTSLEMLASAIFRVVDILWSWTADGDLTVRGVNSAADRVYYALYVDRDQSQPPAAKLGSIADSVATSLTNAVRASRPFAGPSKAGANSFEVAGEVLASVTFVSVRWEWLALLAGQLVLSFAFLAATVVQTAQLGVPVLKSSALAMMLALDGKTRDTAGGMEGVAVMKARAALVHVRLEGRDVVLAEGATAPEVRRLRG